MYARTTTVRGDPRAVEDGIGFVRDSVWPMVQQMSGCVGLSMLADRDAGRCIITAAWATDEAMRASAETVKESRLQAAEMLRADSVDIEEWEIAGLHRVHPAGDGACARVVWSESEQLNGMVDAFRMTLLPQMEELPGFCSVSMLTDPMTGRACAAITYESRDALVRSRGMATGMRDDFAAAMGSRITEVAEFDLVLAHLRVPEMA
jgi:hypothetical protein